MNTVGRVALVGAGMAALPTFGAATFKLADALDDGQRRGDSKLKTGALGVGTFAAGFASFGSFAMGIGGVNSVTDRGIVKTFQQYPFAIGATVGIVVGGALLLRAATPDS